MERAASGHRDQARAGIVAIEDQRAAIDCRGAGVGIVAIEDPLASVGFDE